MLRGVGPLGACFERLRIATTSWASERSNRRGVTGRTSGEAQKKE